MNNSRITFSVKRRFTTNSKRNDVVRLYVSIYKIYIKDAWNPPENSANFPLCVFEVSHVDRTKQQFFCGITVSHDDDSANTEMVAFFKQVNQQQVIKKSRG